MQDGKIEIGVLLKEWKKISNWKMCWIGHSFQYWMDLIYMLSCSNEVGQSIQIKLEVINEDKLIQNGFWSQK